MYKSTLKLRGASDALFKLPAGGTPRDDDIQAICDLILRLKESYDTLDIDSVDTHLDEILHIIKSTPIVSYIPPTSAALLIDICYEYFIRPSMMAENIASVQIIFYLSCAEPDFLEHIFNKGFISDSISCFSTPNCPSYRPIAGTLFNVLNDSRFQSSISEVPLDPVIQIFFSTISPEVLHPTFHILCLFTLHSLNPSIADSILRVTERFAVISPNEYNPYLSFMICKLHESGFFEASALENEKIRAFVEFSVIHHAYSIAPLFTSFISSHSISFASYFTSLPQKIFKSILIGICSEHSKDDICASLFLIGQLVLSDLLGPDEEGLYEFMSSCIKCSDSLLCAEKAYLSYFLAAAFSIFPSSFLQALPAKEAVGLLLQSIEIGSFDEDPSLFLKGIESAIRKVRNLDWEREFPNIRNFLSEDNYDPLPSRD